MRPFKRTKSGKMRALRALKAHGLSKIPARSPALPKRATEKAHGLALSSNAFKRGFVLRVGGRFDCSIGSGVALMIRAS